MHNLKRIALITAVVFLLTAGAVVNSLQLYFMAAVLFCLPCVSYAVARGSLSTIEVSRSVPASGWQGDMAEFELVVRSRSPLPKLGLQMRERLPAWLTVAPDDEGFFDLPVAQEVRIPYSVHLAKRGLYHLDQVAIAAHDPLGLFTISRTWRAPAEIVVYPVPSPIPTFEVRGSDRYGTYETPHSQVHGSGVDPDGVRQYQIGDPLRRIHWKSLARTGDLNVVEYEEALMMHVAVVLDTSCGVDIARGPDSAFEYLVRMAASIADDAVHKGATFRLIAGDDTRAAHPGRGQAHLFTVLDALAHAQGDPSGAPVSADLHRRVGAAARGATIVVLTGGCDPALPDALMPYTNAGVLATVVHCDPGTFDAGHRAPSPGARAAFFDALLASQVTVYHMGRDEGNRLAPERSYGHLAHV